VELVGIERFSRQWNLQVADYTIGEMGKMGGKCSVLVQPLYSEASSAATIQPFPRPYYCVFPARRSCSLALWSEYNLYHSIGYSVWAGVEDNIGHAQRADVA
jgi:hypothetical protein